MVKCYSFSSIGGMSVRVAAVPFDLFINVIIMPIEIRGIAMTQIGQRLNRRSTIGGAPFIGWYCSQFSLNGAKKPGHPCSRLSKYFRTKITFFDVGKQYQLSPGQERQTTQAREQLKHYQCFRLCLGRVPELRHEAQSDSPNLYSRLER